MKKQIPHIITFFVMTLYMSAQECEYREYFRIIDSAKKEYSKHNFKKANEIFKIAFSKTNFPLGHDLSFALISAVEAKDDHWAGTIAEYLAKGGTPLRYFGKYKKEKWYKKFSSNFQKYATFYRDKLNPVLKDKWLALIEKDREFNSKYHEWRVGEAELTIQELTHGANEILEEFKTLTEAYGFPNERIIGYHYVQRKNAIERFPIEGLIVHIYQRGVLIFENEIPKIVCNGGLHPQWIETLKKIRGFGDSTGIEQEMKARYEKFRGTE
ncbi:hypothetical protein [Gaetbulibacter aestuarii]|uniref:Uncharacterized protein n=1 Tax=Gaetbulibacter aestuarii TaxID=1502358 RepID=A0ABW7MXA4_9FLAO